MVSTSKTLHSVYCVMMIGGFILIWQPGADVLIRRFCFTMNMRRGNKLWCKRCSAHLFEFLFDFISFIALVVFSLF